MAARFRAFVGGSGDWTAALAPTENLMTQLDMIEDAIAKLEATVEDAKASVPDKISGTAIKLQPAGSAPTNANALVKAKLSKAKATGQSRSSKPPRSKRAVLQALVERKSGATMSAMMEATGWQAHSVRAGLTGLRKAGVDLERRTNRKGETFYAVARAEAAQ
jgi:aspartokinase